MRVVKPQMVRDAENGQWEAHARELEQVLVQTGEAVIVKDLNAVVTYWNREATSLYGFSAQEAVGQPLRKLHAADLYKLQGEYTYNGGFNPIAVFSLVMGIAPNIPGFLGTIKVVNPATVGPFLMNLYNYAWFVGFAVAFFAYGGFMTVLGKLKPVK